MTNLTNLSISKARELLQAKEISAVELTKAHVSEIEKYNHLNAYTTKTPEMALRQAEESDARLRQGSRKILEGIPLGIKDIFCTKDVTTTAGSDILRTFVPPYESTVSQNLLDAGASFLGKLNCDEFAMGSANLNSAYGAAINPWQKKGDASHLVPGGSSGGSSSAVAAFLAMGATGTDTGGSIRQPAAFTGIVGIKPTYGRCSRYGMIAFASSLDQAGPMTRTVQDAAIMLEAMTGYDPKDSTSAREDVPCFEKAITGNIQGLKVGIPKEYQSDHIDPEILKLWNKGKKWLEANGAEIVEVSLPHTEYALPTYYIIAPAEASSNLARYDGVRYGTRVPGDSLDEMYKNTRSAGFGEEVIRRIMIGTYVLSAGYYDAYYLKAQKVRRLIKQDFDQAFKDVDVLLTPATPNAAFSIDNPPQDPIQMYMNDIFTVPANLAGIPAISVPSGLNSEGLPLGLQLIAPAFAESLLFNTGSIIEREAGFHDLKKEERQAI